MVLRVDHIATRGRNFIWSSKNVAVAKKLCEWLVVEDAVSGVSWRPDGESAAKSYFCVGVAEFDTQLFRLQMLLLANEPFVPHALRVGDLWVGLL